MKFNSEISFCHLVLSCDRSSMSLQLVLSSIVRNLLIFLFEHRENSNYQRMILNMFTYAALHIQQCMSTAVIQVINATI